MEEFKTAGQVEALFASYGVQTQNGQYFIGYDTQVGDKASRSAESFLLAGTVAGGIMTATNMAEHAKKFPYSGLLIAFTDYGIACIQLGCTGLMKTVTKPDKLVVAPAMPLIVMNNVDLAGITIKNYSFVATKTKIVVMTLRNGIEYRLIVNTTEKELPYHEAGFAAFMAKYGKKK